MCVHEHDVTSDRDTQRDLWRRTGWMVESTTGVWFIAVPAVLGAIGAALAGLYVVDFRTAALAVVLLSASAIAAMYAARARVRALPGATYSAGVSAWVLGPRDGLLDAAELLPRELGYAARRIVATNEPFAWKYLPSTVRSAEKVRSRDEAFVVAVLWLVQHDYPDVESLLHGRTKDVINTVLRTALETARSAKTPALV